MNKFAVFFDTDQDFFQQRLNQVKVDRYEKTRNSLDGSVTYLSPYITHGFEALPAIVRYLKMKHSLNTKHKLYAELGWREYFQHVEMVFLKTFAQQSPELAIAQKCL